MESDKFPSGRSLYDALAGANLQGTSAAAPCIPRLETLDIGAAAAGAQLVNFERCANAYERSGIELAALRDRLRTSRAQLDAACTDWVNALRNHEDTRQRFRLSAAGIDPETGRVIQ